MQSVTTCCKVWRPFAIVVLLLAASQSAASQEKQKPAYAMLIDNTGSMRSQFNIVMQLGKELARQLHNRGPVSIFSFESARDRRDSHAKISATVEQTQDEVLLNKGFDGIYVQSGQTTLLDAIEFMAEDLNSKATDRAKFIVLITDGEERASKRSAAQVVEKLQRMNISVYAVGLVRELEPDKRRKAAELLRMISRETGGRAVIVEPGIVNVQNVISELALTAIN